MLESEQEYGDLVFISKLKKSHGYSQHEDFLSKTLTSELSESLDLSSSLKSKIEKSFAKETSSVGKSSSENQNRVVVYARKDSLSLYTPADFSMCLFDYFGVDYKQPVSVECFLENGKVFIQPQEVKRKHQEAGVRRMKKDVYRLEHPVFCALHRLSKKTKETLPNEIAQRGIDVGVAIFIESSDGKLLLTRRAYHMRAFPGVWVPPGGHIEEGENFEQAGIREVREETGLNLPEYLYYRFLGLWESVFPPVLYEGDPRRHHLVVYLNVVLKQSSEQLQNLIKLDPQEVDACMWISEGLVAIAVDGGGGAGNHINNLTIPITLVNSDGSHKTGYLDPKVLRKKMPAPDRIVERLTTGTRYALRLWLQQKKAKKNGF